MTTLRQFAAAALAGGVALVWPQLSQAEKRERPLPREERRETDRERRPADRQERRPVREAVRERDTEVREADDVGGRDRDPGVTRKAKSVIGAKVSIKGGIAIGTVKDILFADDGQIEYLVVRNEGKNVLVPWEAAKFDFKKKSATVNITEERFREVPTFTGNRPTQWRTPAFRQRMYGFYGLTPRPANRPGPLQQR